MSKHMMPAISVAALAGARPCPPALIGSVLAEGPTDPEALLKEVNAKLEEINSEAKKTAESALAEAKKSGDVSAETKVKADELLASQTVLSKTVDELKAMVEGLDAKTLDISQQVAAGAGRPGDRVLSLGEAVIAEHDEKIKPFARGNAAVNVQIMVQNAITTAAGSGGGLIYQEEEREPVRLPRRRLLVRDLLMPGRTSSDLVKYRKQTTRTNAAAPKAEGVAAAESTYGWTKATAEVKTIAHHTNITRETMEDADQLQSEIDGEMRYGLDLVEETQIVAGDGVGENLSGLLTEATAFAAAAGLPNATRIDRLRLAMLQLTLADYVATAMLLNPTDWAAIDLLKVGGTDNRYIFGNPGSGTTPMLWGKDVVETNTMSVNEWLVGDLPMAATFYDRRETEVLISSEHGTNFVEGMLTMMASKRVALAIKRPAALITGDFTFP